MTPLDLETTFGITEGNIFHGDISLEQLFFMRPIPGWARYGTPIGNLYLCGAGTHPGGGVTGFAKAYKRERVETLVKTVDFANGRKTAALARTGLRLSGPYATYLARLPEREWRGYCIP